MAQRKYFYKELDYGSQSVYNPLSVILNGSYDIIQLDEKPREIFNLPYKDGFKNVFKNLSNPFGVIKKTGWKDFVSNEVLPITLTKKGAQWWPNYQLHLIGGGMTYRATAEWYEAKGFAEPKLFSMATMAAYHLLNEAVENGSFSGCNADPVADIYIFDIGGIILFSYDNVCRFFSEDLNLSDWSLQPSFTFNPVRLHNNGQYFSIKWKLPFSEKFHFFYYFGMNGLGGLSYKFNDSSYISIGGGMRAKNLETVDKNYFKNTIKMTWNAGIFYDINNSLMTSLFFSGLTSYKVNLNIYPGMLKIGNFSPGLWMVLQDRGKLLFGITTTWLPGAGAGL
ncbi:MAG: hypothetical protein K8H86_11035 [Ignavibacteriaceae bacterium]|nr:hypothetical protein [Ignavibacteriaceae bacterium]